MGSRAARYDGHSEYYDEHFGPGHRPAEELAFLREALGTGHGQVCVDLACGTAALRQVARCLRPDGRFIYAGLHPCFIGPFVNRMSESDEQRLQFLPGYGHVGWANRGSGDGTGLAGRVGFHHKTLAHFLGAIVSSGLHIRAVRDFASSGVVLPRNIGLVAEK